MIASGNHDISLLEASQSIDRVTSCSNWELVTILRLHPFFNDGRR